MFHVPCDLCVFMFPLVSSWGISARSVYGDARQRWELDQTIKNKTNKQNKRGMTLSISLSTMSPYADVVSVLGVQSNHARVGQVRAQDMFAMAPIRTCEERCGERRGQTGDGPWL